jgi:hypothetical protein
LEAKGRGIKALQQFDAPRVHLLFEPGKRPEVAAVHAFVAAWDKVVVSHDPAAEHSATGYEADLTGPERITGARMPADARQWVELLRNGLTFDLVGLAPGLACDPPAIAHRFDWPDKRPADSFESLCLRAGPHIEGGAAALPVLRTMVGLARDLAFFFEELAAVVWAPSFSIIGRRFFESTATAWLDGGPFPALGLTAFDVAPDGALESTGLKLWVGHEMRIDPVLSTDRIAATRLGVRLINHLVRLGGLRSDEQLIAPDGTRLVMVPASDDGLIVVQRE